MLLKLFKYDFKASARFGVPLLIAIAAMTILGCISTAVTVGNAGAESFETATNAPFEEMLIFFGMGGLVLISFALAAAAAVTTCAGSSIFCAISMAVSYSLAAR